MVKYSSQELDSVFFALSDPIRRGILAGLASGERTVGEVAEPFDVALPAITRHLNVLEKAGLISRRSSGRQKFCRVEGKALKHAGDWIEYYSQFWVDRLDQLEVFLENNTES